MAVIRLNVTVDAETVALLERLHEADGISVSAAVRRGVACYAAERGVRLGATARPTAHPPMRELTVAPNEDTY